MNRLNDEWFSSKSESVPLWHKIALSIDEMYVYTGIGRETIRELTKQPEAKQFTLKIGKRTLIKRKQFEEYLDQIQDALGHKDVSTTLNIYTDVTKELRKSEFEGLELQFNQ